MQRLRVVETVLPPKIGTVVHEMRDLDLFLNWDEFEGNQVPSLFSFLGSVDGHSDTRIWPWQTQSITKPENHKVSRNHHEARPLIARFSL